MRKHVGFYKLHSFSLVFFPARRFVFGSSVMPFPVLSYDDFDVTNSLMADSETSLYNQVKTNRLAVESQGKIHFILYFVAFSVIQVYSYDIRFCTYTRMYEY